MDPLRKLLGHLAGALGVLGIALFFLVFSCSQKLPTSPVGPEQTVAPAPGGPQTSLPLLGEPIGWLGGTVSVPVENTNNISLLAIPAGGLSQAVTITAGGRYDQNENATFYDLRPDGLKFLKPVLLVHRAREPDGKKLVLWYFNPNSQKWEKEGSARIVAGSVTFSLLHFSNWAVAEEGDGLGSGGQ